MKVLKNIKNVFYKSCKNKDLSLQERFSYRDSKSERFLDIFDRTMERNYFQTLLHPIETTIVGTAHYNNLKSDLLWFINNFTMTDEISDEDMKIIEAEVMKKRKQIKAIEYSNRENCIIYLKNNREISFQTITSSFENMEEYPDLTTHVRDGKCHMRSIYLTDDIQQPCYCVTGFVAPFTSRAKFLHSWVEMEHNDKVYCIDNNYNVLMPKADYYYLQNPKIIQRISQKRINEDRKAILYLNDRACKETPYIKLYCTSPDEAIEKYNELKRLEAEEEAKRLERRKDLPFYIQEL